MGLLDETLDGLPPRDELDADLIDHVVELTGLDLLDRYEVAYNGLLAFSREPALEITPQAVQQAKQVAEKLKREVTKSPGSVRPSTNSNWTGEINSLQGAVDNALNWWRESGREVTRGGSVAWAEQIERADQLSTRAEHLTEEAELLAERVRTLTTEVGTGELASHYAEQARLHQNAARAALVAMGVAVSALVGVGWWLLATIPDTTNWVELTRHALTRAVVLGALSFGVAFCSRIYRNNAHLRAVYDQKVSALRTFMLFSRSLEGDELTRTMVLEQVVRAVFTAADTGFLDGGGSDKTIIEQVTPVASLIRPQ